METIENTLENSAKLLVYFVKCNETSEITACFLNTKAFKSNNEFIDCYTSKDGHVTSDKGWVFEKNTQATKQEYLELYKELLRVGYKDSELQIFNY